jgi:hypothetical protein
LEPIVFCAAPSPHSCDASSSDIGTVSALTPSVQLIASHIHYAKLPPLVVTDQKLGPDHRGAVGFWIETGPMGYFSNLKISPMAVRKISCANPF